MATCGIGAEPCMHREFTRSLFAIWVAAGCGCAWSCSGHCLCPRRHADLDLRAHILHAGCRARLHSKQT